MKQKRKFYPYIMIAPAMLTLFTFVIYPTLYLIILSFTDWNLISPTKKNVGLRNFVALFSRAEFLNALGNTFVYTLIHVSILMVLSILLALWFSKHTKIDRIGQTAIFTPHIISLVSVSMVWMWIMDPDMGLLNYLLSIVGIPPLKWLQSSSTALLSIIIVTTWKAVGYYALITLAALQGIPKEIYEAAELDNAKGGTLFFNITLPMISPQLFIQLIIMTIGSFKTFDTINIMTGGGPNGATEMLVHYIYDYAFVHMKIGYASSAAVILLIITSVVTIIYFNVLSHRVHYQ